MRGNIMFTVGDKVSLTKDFNNEPGIIPAGTMGKVTHIDSDSPVAPLVYVQFTDLRDFNLAERVRIMNHEVGLPMYPEEIEKVYKFPLC
jgi:hypothetical protein